MSQVFVKSVKSTAKHPVKDHLSILILSDDSQLVSENLADGSVRYATGELVVHVPHNSIVPDYLLRQGFWDHENDKPYMKGNRVKASNFATVKSEGILFPVVNGTVTNHMGQILAVEEGTDVTEFWMITEWKA